MKLACVRGLNTKDDGFPATYALSFDCRTETAFPSLVDARPGPAWNERCAIGWYVFSGLGLREIYDTKKRMLHLQAFYVNPRWVENYLKLSDEEILQQCSTSPLYEPPNFVQGKNCV